MWYGRPLWAEIDLDALTHNLREVQRRVGPAEILAVVKANGYGHGAVMVSQTLLRAGAHRLGVACVDEGVQLRQAGIQAPILVMGATPPWEAERVVQHRLTPTVTSQQLALALARFSSAQDIVTPVHLKVDTGMNRFGLRPPEVQTLAQALRSFPSLRVEGLYSHFATADEADKAFTRQQFAALQAVAQELPWIPLRHVANSAAIADLPEMALDMVRPGICLYGCAASASISPALTLRPVLSLKSRVARVQWLEPGESVSYGLTWQAPRRSRVALICCGYADGLPRLLSNRGSVLLHGQRAPVVGRICMDQCMVDVTHLPQVVEGDEAVLIGRQGDAEIAVEEIAELAGTISYEVLCGISTRVPRVYLQGGAIRSVQTLVETQHYPPVLEEILAGSSGEPSPLSGS